MARFPDMSAAKAAIEGLENNQGDEQGSEQSEPSRLFTIINPVDLVTLPIPQRKWIVEDWLPTGCVTANYGDGGVGKTLLAQQLMTATAIGVPWCGMEVQQVRSFGFFCEDDEAELHRRQVSICNAYGAKLSDLEAMRWVSGIAEDNSLMDFDYGNIRIKSLYQKIKQGAKDHDARLIIMDTAADLFSGNENDRHQVRLFIALLHKLAIELRAAVLLNAHPSRAGLASGALDGGSTGWNNSVRSRWSLGREEGKDKADEDTNIRILTKRKANYSTIGDEIKLQWIDGILMPPRGLGRVVGAARAAEAEAVFLKLLAGSLALGQRHSHNNRAGNYAPKEFAKHPKSRGYLRSDFEAAMRRLFAAGRIFVEDYGRRSDARQRIAIASRAAVAGDDD